MELKPCPFCGGEAKEQRFEAYSLDSSFDYIGCTECQVMIFEGNDADWNTRTQETK